MLLRKTLENLSHCCIANLYTDMVNCQEFVKHILGMTCINYESHLETQISIWKSFFNSFELV
jgi:hypothetical protein